MDAQVIESVDAASDIEVSIWKQISNLIFQGGYKEGYEAGRREGVATYTFRRRFFYKTFEFILGALLGLAIGGFFL